MKGGGSHSPLPPLASSLLGAAHPQYLRIHSAESVYCHISIIIY